MHITAIDLIFKHITKINNASNSNTNAIKPLIKAKNSDFTFICSLSCF